MSYFRCWGAGWKDSPANLTPIAAWLYLLSVVTGLGAILIWIWCKRMLMEDDFLSRPLYSNTSSSLSVCIEVLRKYFLPLVMLFFSTMTMSAILTESHGLASGCGCRGITDKTLYFQITTAAILWLPAHYLTNKGYDAFCTNGCLLPPKPPRWWRLASRRPHCRGYGKFPLLLRTACRDGRQRSKECQYETPQ